MKRYVSRPGGVIEPCNDWREWGRWFESSHWVPFLQGGRVMAKTYTAGGVEVSTVFLGLDHGFRVGPSILFETMVLGGPHDGYQRRCSTLAEAQAMHTEAVRVALSPPTEEDAR